MSLRREEAKKAWRAANAVCLDVDSTVIKLEGIDKLAHFCGVGEEVTKLTRRAMGGSMTFREALTTRLGIIKPSLQQVLDFRRLHSPEAILTPGIEDLVQHLRSRGTAVYLISGGFKQLLEPVVEHLGILNTHVYANRLLFGDDGQYAGFDVSEPTSQSGGKTHVVAQIKRKHETVVMIGDGATDMEAHPPADTFIGFGGNVVREKVKAGAPWFVHSFQDLIDELKIGVMSNGFMADGYMNGYAEEMEGVWPKIPSDIPELSNYRIPKGVADGCTR